MPTPSQKPLVPVVNWANPYTRGLVFAWVPTNKSGTSNLRALPGNQPGTAVNVVAADFVGSSKYGVGVDFLGTNQYLSFGALPAADLKAAKRASILAFVQYDAVNAAQTCIGKWTPNSGWGFGLSSTGKINFHRDGDAAAPGSTTLSVGVDYATGVIWDGVNLNYYLNGLPDGTAAKSSDPTSFGQVVTLGVIGTATFLLNGRLYGVYLWDRDIGARAMQSISADPWQLVTETDAWSQSNLVGAFMNGPLAPVGGQGTYPGIFPPQAGYPFGGILR